MTDAVNPRQKAGVAALVLRLAVAAVLAFDGGYAYVRAADAEPSQEPQHSELRGADPVDRAIDQAIALRDEPLDSKAVNTAVLNDRGLQLGVPQIVGLIEIAFAATLFFGVLVRVAGLVGVILIVTAGLTVEGIIDPCPYLTWVNNIFVSNPPAAMLLGAICLSFVFSGAGPLSVDRLLFARREMIDAPPKPSG